MQRENLFKFSIATFRYKQELYRFRDEVLQNNIKREDIERDLLKTYDNVWLNKSKKDLEDTEIQREINRRNLLKCIDEGIEVFNFSSNEIKDGIGFVSFENKIPEEEYLKKMDKLYKDVVEGIKLKFIFS